MFTKTKDYLQSWFSNEDSLEMEDGDSTDVMVELLSSNNEESVTIFDPNKYGLEGTDDIYRNIFSITEQLLTLPDKTELEVNIGNQH
ncbi:MAG: hypothetical protein H0U73_11100 [Tatlockia sp.]|nr:hypothetical protein [Tatlockia sp.]